MKRFIALAAFFLASCSGQKDFHHLTFSGTMEMTEHILGAKAPGRVVKLDVKEGDLVKRGQQLAVLDRFEQAKKDYARLEVLYKNGGANQQVLEYARLAMEDQQVIAPLDGIVLVKAVETGEVIPAGAGVVVVGDPLEKWVRIFFPEGLMHYLSLNQKAVIHVDGTSKQYKGHISFLAAKAEFTPRNTQTSQERVTQTFAVKITVDDADAYLHAGVAADVKFTDRT